MLLFYTCKSKFKNKNKKANFDAIYLNIKKPIFLLSKISRMYYRLPSSSSKFLCNYYTLVNNSFKQNLLYDKSNSCVLYQLSKKLTTTLIQNDTKKKYNTEPPIDLKSVRTNSYSDDQKNKKSGEKVAPLLLFSIPIITFCLGVWQINRRESKLNLIKFLEERTETEPMALPTDPKELENLLENHEYKPFKVKGHFLHSKEIILSPRSDLTGSSQITGGWVVTPFVLSKPYNFSILINRGYVPYTNYSPLTREKAQIEDEVELVGLLRSNEITNTFTPINKPPFEWHYRDVNLMAQTLGTAPIFLDATKSSNLKGGPIGGQTAINLRNNHMSYIITWFSLSGLTGFLWWSRFAKLFF